MKICMQKIISWIKAQKSMLVIANNSILTKIKTELSKQHLFLDIVFKTQEEITKEVLGEYLLEPSFLYANKCNLEIDLMRQYQSFFPYLEDVKEHNVSFLLDRKAESFSFLKKSPQKVESYLSRAILLVEENILANEWRYVKEELTKHFEITHIAISEVQGNLTYLEFTDAKEEVMHVVFSIAKLLDLGLAADKIKVHIVNESYLPLLEEVFYLYNIDITNLRKTKLSTHPFFLTFIAKLTETSQSASLEECIQEALQNSTKALPNVDKQIVNQLIQWLNQMDFTQFTHSLCIEFLTATAKTMSLHQVLSTNTIEIGDFTFTYIEQDATLFVLGFAQNSIPKVYLDEEFLTDDIKARLGMITSVEKNHFIKEHWKHKLATIEKVHLSFSYHVFNNAFVQSSFLKTLLEEGSLKQERPLFETIRYSKKQDEILYAKYIDKKMKYDIIDENLHYLESVFSQAPYRTYENQFDGIDHSTLEDYLKNKFSLSYTALDLFYNCPFAFYVEKILRIRRTTNKTALFIGNLYHAVLETYLKENREMNLENLKSFMTAFSKEHENPLGVRFPFYLEKFAQDLMKILETIQKQQNQSDFVVKGYEDTRIIRLENDYQTKMSGKVDKLMTIAYKGKTYGIVIDYKTGNTHFDYNYVENGLDMQTLIYFYLYKKSGLDLAFGGAYLQSVFLNPINEEENKTLEDQVWDELKLSGYTNADLWLLEKIDKDVKNHTFLKSIAFKKGGILTAIAEKRTLTDETFDALLKRVEQKIYEGVEKIEKGEFFVSPIRVGNKDACKYCPYQDLCFKREANYKKVDKADAFSFLETEGGDTIE